MAAQHLLLIWSCLVPTLGATTEREALRALANATNLQGWQRRNNWLTQAPICDWEGVGCDRDGSVRPRRRALSTAEKHTSISQVKILALSFNNMTGRLPRSLDLPALEDLDVERNAMSGAAPAMRFPRLRQLGLGGNAFTAGFPLCDELARIVDAAGAGTPPCDLSGTSFDCTCAEAMAKCGAPC